MADAADRCRFFAEYDLVAARRKAAPPVPAPHQDRALAALNDWYAAPRPGGCGGILVLPTGGGKTFTAWHFLCRNPLSRGHKVLWLAHTHHLLEQAYFGLNRLAPLIDRTRKRLTVRVVSGTTGHSRVRSILPSDDVLICSLQTASNAYVKEHERFDEFLAAAGDDLAVVFDEAHHAPATSYRKLIQGLKDRCKRLCLLGMTATPTHSESRKRGWLESLFPQGILYQTEARALMADRVLAQPVLEEARTGVTPAFDDRAYEEWAATNRDLPEAVVRTLAENEARNAQIVGHYVANRERYGKAIFFADNWLQCEQLCKGLNGADVAAGAIYHHVEANPGTVEARGRRKASENAAVLDAFRNGGLRVLVNVRMATEGTDVPDAQTVFLTRQTTSQILLNQMVGRALRGPRFGGTERAYIVSFIDNWRHRINWASYEQVVPGLTLETPLSYSARQPLELVSIDLVRRLLRQRNSGAVVLPIPCHRLLPVGWYRVEYRTLVGAGGDDDEPVGRLVLVFDHEREGFERFISALLGEDLQRFEEPGVRFADEAVSLDQWAATFFPEAGERVGACLQDDLFAIARHVAQVGDPPTFFPFALRDDHDLDRIAAHLAGSGSELETRAALRREYDRPDRYWTVLYPEYDLYEYHFGECAVRARAAPRGHDEPLYTTPEATGSSEPPQHVKDAVLSRDGYRCRCCGYDTHRSRLQVDHIQPVYQGGTHSPDNLQTLCTRCNSAKGGVRRIDFRERITSLTAAPTQLVLPPAPDGERAGDSESWKRYLRRVINLLFECSAVDGVTEMLGRGGKSRWWSVRLVTGNRPEWLEPHLGTLAGVINQSRGQAGFPPTRDEIRISS